MIKKLYDRLYKKIAFFLYYHYPNLRNQMLDKMYLQCKFYEFMGYNIDFRNPKTFCEKLNWLKLYDHNPLYHKLVDKYEVKKIVSEKIGEERIIKTLALYNSVEEINLDYLPNQFVLKCTHDSGSVIVCSDKKTFDFEAAKEKLQKCINTTDYYYYNREWAYKGVKPRIIAEEYIETLLKPETEEYKVTCINGKVKMITICSGIAHGEDGTRFNDHFDRDFNRIPFWVEYPPAGKILQPSENVDEMIRICEKLAEGIPQVRVDLYNHHDKLLFGEMTFYTWGGFMHYNPNEWDRKMGDWLELPHKKE